MSTGQTQNLLEGLYLWPGSTVGSPRKSVLLRREMSGSSSWIHCLPDPTTDQQKKIDEWILCNITFKLEGRGSVSVWICGDRT